ncbi:uncharacterized protein METZ01_LOCUS126480 [marine metagenome]|uniref:Uncharacterized protein n=1 Tax=marine metagenome TaxID=408172 RepID=A0A381Y939_9ZZZZ
MPVHGPFAMHFPMHGPSMNGAVEMHTKTSLTRVIKLSTNGLKSVRASFIQRTPMAYT